MLVFVQLDSDANASSRLDLHPSGSEPLLQAGTYDRRSALAHEEPVGVSVWFPCRTLIALFVADVVIFALSYVTSKSNSHPGTVSNVLWVVFLLGRLGADRAWSCRPGPVGTFAARYHLAADLLVRLMRPGEVVVQEMDRNRSCMVLELI
jgi:hypothetical protein